MSVPATGRMSFYRNPLPEVARFFETRHPGRYMVFNCCPEHPYPTGKFATGVFHQMDIQDHTPPTMAQMVQFLNAASTFVAGDAGRVLVVHCRGGKGRTGSLCCAWLLYTCTCVDAEDALQMFALERTELGLGRKKLQGVDTPSQRRFVHAIAALLVATERRCPPSSDPQAAAGQPQATAEPREQLASLLTPSPVPLHLPTTPRLYLRHAPATPQEPFFLARADR